MDKATLYTEKEVLEEFIIFSDQYPNWNEIIRKHTVWCVNLSDQELFEIWNEDNDIFSFCHGNDLPYPIALASYFTSLKEDYSHIAEKPRSIFILDETEENTNNLQSQFGVLVLSKNRIDDKVFNTKCFKELNKADTITGDSTGWSNLMMGISLPPSNSIVVSDNYLFSNKEHGSGRFFGEDNIVKLLENILPNELAIAFHILIVCNIPDISKQECNQLIGKIKTKITSLRKYELVLEFVFTDTLHKRKLFSNYYSITCDKGFAMFQISNDTIVRDENDFNLTTAFYDAKSNSGDTDFFASSKKLKAIKKTCQDLQVQINSGVNDHTKRIIGDCNKDKSINNRLVQSI